MDFPPQILLMETEYMETWTFYSWLWVTQDVQSEYDVLDMGVQQPFSSELHF